MSDISFLHNAAHARQFIWPEHFWQLPHSERKQLAKSLAADVRMRMNGHAHVLEANEAFNNLPAIEIHNLIYHVCPIKENDGWRHNINQLCKRIEIFNGRRIVAVATGENLELPSTVHKAFGNHAIEFIELPNDVWLREVVSFLPLLIKVCNTNENEATFYAHTKGNSTEGNRQGAAYWRNVMYQKLLTTNAIDCLRNNAFVGTHKLCWPNGANPPYPSRLQHGNWMMAGTFFWFRHDLIFQRNWRNVPVDRYGAESWPSGMFAHTAAHSMFQPWPIEVYPTPSPYDVELYQNDDRIEDENLQLETSIQYSKEAWDALLYREKPRYEIDIPATKMFRQNIAGPKTIVVIGAYRGGTSFIGECLQELKIPIGEFRKGVAEKWAYCNYEDVEFKDVVEAKDWNKLQELATANDAVNDIWGFKVPATVFHLDFILPLLRNPHLIVVTRDPLAAHQGDEARSNKVTFNAARFHSNAVFDCLTHTRAPTLAVCFERGKSARAEVKQAIREFIQCESVST